MLDIFETRKLVQTVNQVQPATTFITDTFFSNKDVSDAENIDVEIYVGKRKLAPFVAPKQEGKVIASEGKTVQTYKPAYVKFKYITEAEEVARKSEGVFYADGSNSTKRAVDKAVREILEGRNMIARRVEFMATEALTTGKTTITGDGFDEVIDFQMPATHLKTLTGDDLWTDSSSDPITDLRAWKREVAKDSGYTPNKAVMGSSVIDAFLANSKVQTYLSERRIELGNIKPTNMGEGVTSWGVVEGLEIYSYDSFYEVDGETYDLFPASKVLLGSTMAKTVQAYGAIKDLRSGSFVGEVFVKTWEEEDPSVRYVLMQSAPLSIPTQVSAFMCNKVV